MFTPYVSVEDAQVRSQQVFHEVIEKINNMYYIDRIINDHFRTRIIDILNNTSITWKKWDLLMLVKLLKMMVCFLNIKLK